jgi:hypothetical protein
VNTTVSIAFLAQRIAALEIERDALRTDLRAMTLKWADAECRLSCLSRYSTQDQIDRSEELRSVVLELLRKRGAPTPIGSDQRCGPRSAVATRLERAAPADRRAVAGIQIRRARNCFDTTSFRR